MQKWEYCEIEVTIGGPLSGITAEGWIFKSDKKAETFNGKYGTLFAKLGLEGWEMVVASARTDAGPGKMHKINYMFKRPVEG